MRVRCAAAAAVVVMLGGTATGAAHATTRSAGHALRFNPLVGSTRDLIYEEWHAGSNHHVLVARIHNGHSTHVVDDVPRHVTGYSLAQSVLTAVRTNSAGEATHKVRWWNVESGRHGVIRLPAKADYLAAAPGGAIASVNGRVREYFSKRRPSRSLGRPFAHDLIDDAQTSSFGFIVVNDSNTGLRYQEWNARGRFDSLRLGPNHGYAVHCSALTLRFVSCGVDRRARLIPLNGAHPVTEVNVAAFHTGTVISTLFVQSNDPGRHLFQIGSASKGSSKITWSKRRYGHMVSALGKVITVTRKHPHHLIALSSGARGGRPIKTG